MYAKSRREKFNSLRESLHELISLEYHVRNVVRQINDLDLDVDRYVLDVIESPLTVAELANYIEVLDEQVQPKVECPEPFEQRKYLVVGSTKDIRSEDDWRTTATNLIWVCEDHLDDAVMWVKRKLDPYVSIIDRDGTVLSTEENDWEP